MDDNAFQDEFNQSQSIFQAPKKKVFGRSTNWIRSSARTTHYYEYKPLQCFNCFIIIVWQDYT